MFNISFKRVGGIVFIKIGRINISFSVAKHIVSQKDMDNATYAALVTVQKSMPRNMGTHWVSADGSCSWMDKAQQAVARRRYTDMCNSMAD